MGMIVPISGVSGAGKTTLFQHLLSSNHGYVIIPSVTTRNPRERDLPGEFLHVTPEDFTQKEALNEFLWLTPPLHGARYGTLRASVDDAIARNGNSAMVITVNNVKDLVLYAWKESRDICSLHILSPGDAEIRRRLTLRGEELDAVNERIHSCRTWDTEAIALSYHLPINLLSNNRDIPSFLKSAENRLRNFNTR